jgi:hypothetical protein
VKKAKKVKQVHKVL